MTSPVFTGFLRESTFHPQLG